MMMMQLAYNHLLPHTERGGVWGVGRDFGCGLGCSREDFAPSRIHLGHVVHDAIGCRYM